MLDFSSAVRVLNSSTNRSNTTAIELHETSLLPALDLTTQKRSPLPKTLLSPHPLPKARIAQYIERGGIIILIAEDSDNALEIPNIYSSADPTAPECHTIMAPQRASRDIRGDNKDSHEHVFLPLIDI